VSRRAHTITDPTKVLDHLRDGILVEFPTGLANGFDTTKN
jgi:hypothetical protein